MSFLPQSATIRRNSVFLLEVVLPLVEHRYAEATGHTHAGRAYFTYPKYSCNPASR